MKQSGMWSGDKLFFPAAPKRRNPFPKTGVLTGRIVRIDARQLAAKTYVKIVRGRYKGIRGYIKGDLEDSLARGLYRFIVYFDNGLLPEIYNVKSFEKLQNNS